MKRYILTFLILFFFSEAFKNPRPEEPGSLNTIELSSSDELREFMSYSPGAEPLVSAHRGGETLFFPENCIETFTYTLSQVHALIEVDPRYTADSIIVLMHDETLDRTTSGTGKVSDHTCAGLSNLRLKDYEGNLTDFKIPTLDEVLIWARNKTILILDSKNVPLEARVAKITEHKAEAYAMVIVYSFDEAVHCFKLNPGIMMEIMLPDSARVELFDKTGVPWQNVVGFISHNVVNDRAIFDLIHSRGIKCIVGSSRNYDIAFKKGEISSIGELNERYRSMINGGADIIEADLAIEAGRAIAGMKRGGAVHSHDRFLRYR